MTPLERRFAELILAARARAHILDQDDPNSADRRSSGPRTALAVLLLSLGMWVLMWLGLLAGAWVFSWFSW